MSNGQEIQLLDVRKHKEILTRPQQIEALEKWCSAGQLRAEALIRYALAEMEVNDDLRNCTPTSVYLALLACGVTGLVPGKLRGFSFLVPFGNKKKVGEGKEQKEIVVHEATFMMGWRGCKHIGYRAGLDLVSAVIHVNDTFDFDKGSKPFVTYKPALKGAGPQIGAAAWVVLPRGMLEIEYMANDELQKIKDAATRIRKSPAWDGPFRDQMERKSVLKRLSKQVESGEEFFKANAIEQAQEDHGSPASALDELTDGTASKFLGQRSAEAAAFEHLPRNAQVQVPDSPAAANQQAPAQQGVPARASNRGTSRPRVVDAQATQNPTTGSSGQQTSSSGATAQGSSAGSPAGQPSSSKPAAASSSATAGAGAGAAASPTSPTPATSTGGSQNAPASAPTPASTSPSSSTTSPTDNQTASSADGREFDQDQDENQEEAGDVASEPSPDGDFDLAFGEDPVDSEPAAAPTRQDLIAEFMRWAEAHPTRDAVAADPSWKEIVTAWLAACGSAGEIDEHKPVFTQWSTRVFSKGRAADAKKNQAAIPPDEGVGWLVRSFGERYKQVPA